jgi:hypothetical protein
MEGACSPQRTLWSRKKVPIKPAKQNADPNNVRKLGSLALDVVIKQDRIQSFRSFVNRLRDTRGLNRRPRTIAMNTESHLNCIVEFARYDILQVSHKLRNQLSNQKGQVAQDNKRPQILRMIVDYSIIGGSRSAEKLTNREESTPCRLTLVESDPFQISSC